MRSATGKESVNLSKRQRVVYCFGNIPYLWRIIVLFYCSFGVCYGNGEWRYWMEGSRRDVYLWQLNILCPMNHVVLCNVINRSVADAFKNAFKKAFRLRRCAELVRCNCFLYNMFVIVYTRLFLVPYVHIYKRLELIWICCLHGLEHAWDEDWIRV